MISPIELIAGPALNISYERLLNKDSGIGINVVVLLDNGDNDGGLQSQISPYYRMYFGKKYASGFFVEGFGMVMSIDGKKIYDTEEKITFTENPDVINLSIGVGLGWKGVTKSGFTYGANLGWGKMLFNANKTDHTQVAKFSLNVGYRF